MSRIPVFVVSLQRAAERRKRMLDHLSMLGVSARLIDAVDGKLLPEEDRRSLVAPGVEIHAGAIGCYLSHLIIYRAMVEEGIPVALVLEDDARLNGAFKRILDAGVQSDEFDYCFLDSDDHNDRCSVFYDRDDSVPIATGVRAHLLSAGPQTTHAYMITLEAARKRLEAAFPISKAIDLYDHLPYAIRFRAIVAPKMAWVSADSLESFTSERSLASDALSLVWLRRSLLFYRVRDILKFKLLKRAREARSLVDSGLLARGRRWRALPSGREVVL